MPGSSSRQQAQVHQAAFRWQQRQARLLAAAYLQAWQQGARNFQQTVQQPAGSLTTGQSQSPQPSRPDQARMRQALGPAMRSLASMGAQIAALTPATVTAATGATVMAGAAGVNAADQFAAGMKAALEQYLKSNGYRAKLGAYVTWAGEQAGYVEAGAAAGMLFRWQLEPGAHHCMDCPSLADLPAMPLSQWPTLPGMGATDCGVGCKCSMVAAGVAPTPLSAAQLQVVRKVAGQVRQLVAV